MGNTDSKEERILVIGNGFDLYHGLRTRYYDFVQYTRQFHRNSSIAEICKGNNILKYFQNVVDKNDEWIDCEERIAFVVDLFSKVISKLENKSQLQIPVEELTEEEKFALKSFTKYVEKTNVQVFQMLSKWVNPYKELDKRKLLIALRNELDEVITVLNFYLCEHVEMQRVEIFSEQIKNIEPMYVINFNYTNTCNRIYGIAENRILYVHGKVHSWFNNMVLGIEDNDDENLDFVYYKKYFQCIQKRLKGLDCKQLEKTWGLNCKAYFFGHSLSKNDGEKIIEIEKSVQQMIIFYMNQEDYERKIINLIKIFGKKNAVEKFRTNKIVFIEIEAPKSNLYR